MDGQPLRYGISVYEEWDWAPSNCGYIEFNATVINGTLQTYGAIVRAGSCDNKYTWICETSECVESSSASLSLLHSSSKGAHAWI